MSADSVFRQKAPWMMRKLIEEFALTINEAAAIAGNGGHESAGFTKLQEIKPTVPGSRGGYGWFQWTGPRRRDFEAWCKTKGLAPESDEANYGFLAHELKTTEKKAIAAVRAEKTLREKVIAFEKSYERAGVKHYDSRVRWAEIALDAYSKAMAAQPPKPDPKPEPEPPAPVPPPAQPGPAGAGKGIAGAVLGGVAALVAALVYWLTKGG